MTEVSKSHAGSSLLRKEVTVVLCTQVPDSVQTVLLLWPLLFGEDVRVLSGGNHQQAGHEEAHGFCGGLGERPVCFWSSPLDGSKQVNEIPLSEF